MDIYEPGALDLLNDFIKQARLKELKKAKKTLEDIANVNLKDMGRVKIDVTKNICRKIYEIGEAFSTLNARVYVDIINRLLKEKNNFLLRLIRQEIMYYSNEYDEEELFEVNNIDLKKFPNNPHFLNFKGLIYLEKEEFENSLKYINKAIELEENVDFIRNKAIILNESGEYEKANEIVEYALGIEPKYSALRETQDMIEKQIKEDEIEDSFSSIKIELKNIKNEQNKLYFNIIEILSIFVVIIGVLFSAIKFGAESALSLNEIIILLVTISIVAGVLILFIHLLVRIK